MGRARYPPCAVLEPGHVSVARSTRDSIAADVAAAGVDTGVDLALEAADVGEVVEAGGGVFEVLIDGVGFVAEVVVDAVAGIFSARG